MKSLYENILLKCNEKKSKYYLYLISFFESIIFPIPTDVFIVPFVLADKNSFIKIGIFTTFFSTDIIANENENTIDNSFSLPPSIFLINGIIFWVLSHIIMEGIKLKKENELTI